MVIALACSAVCLLICLPLYLHYKPLRLSLSLCFKSLGTCCALVPALIAALKLDPVCWVCVAALSLHCGADLLLEYSFVMGAGLFLLGHICYISLFLTWLPLSAAMPVCLIVFLAGLARLLYKNRSVIGKNIVPCAVYGAVLSFMAALGIAGGSAAASTRGIMIALGSALFFFSDGLIFRSLLRPELTRPHLTIMASYYAAQLLLGSACLF